MHITFYLKNGAAYRIDYADISAPYEISFGWVGQSEKTVRGTGFNMMGIWEPYDYLTEYVDKK